MPGTIARTRQPHVGGEVGVDHPEPVGQQESFCGLEVLLGDAARVIGQRLDRKPAQPVHAGREGGRRDRERGFRQRRSSARRASRCAPCPWRFAVGADTKHLQAGRPIGGVIPGTGRDAVGDSFRAAGQAGLPAFDLEAKLRCKVSSPRCRARPPRQRAELGARPVHAGPQARGPRAEKSFDSSGCRRVHALAGMNIGRRPLQGLFRPSIQ